MCAWYACIRCTRRARVFTARRRRGAEAPAVTGIIPINGIKRVVVVVAANGICGRARDPSTCADRNIRGFSPSSTVARRDAHMGTTPRTHPASREPTDQWRRSCAGRRGGERAARGSVREGYTFGVRGRKDAPAAAAAAWCTEPPPPPRSKPKSVPRGGGPSPPPPERLPRRRRRRLTTTQTHPTAPDRLIRRS